MKVDFLEKNLSLVKVRWPEVYQTLVGAPPSGIVAYRSEGPCQTLEFDGILLGSGYERGREAQIQGSLVPEQASEAWVYGPGLGDLPRTLLRRPAMRHLNVVVMNPAVFYESLRYFDHKDWLDDPRVKILTAPSLKELGTPFAAVPPCLQLADNQSSKLRDMICLELATPYICEKQFQRREEFSERLFENLHFVQGDGDVASLFGSQKNGTIKVAAAGPTLKEHFRWLRQQRSFYFLVAVDAAVKPLAEAGVFPDVVVSVDSHQKSIASFFQGFDLTPFQDVPLVYFPSVFRKALELWPGPRLTAYPSTGSCEFLQGQYPKGVLHASGSVVHSAVDLAVRMGAAQLDLLGADFSYPSGFTHVEGCSVNKRRTVQPNAHWVLDGYGNRVETIPNLRGYLRDLEHYIANHPQVHFVNGSRRGAFIEGTSYREVDRDDN